MVSREYFGANFFSLHVASHIAPTLPDQSLRVLALELGTLRNVCLVVGQNLDRVALLGLLSHNLVARHLLDDKLVDYRSPHLLLLGLLCHRDCLFESRLVLFEPDVGTMAFRLFDELLNMHLLCCL